MQYAQALHINNIIETEVKATVAKLNASAKQAGVNRSVRITYKLRTKPNEDIYNRISFVFPKFLIYIEKGARRGHGGYKGSTWITQKGNTASTNPNSLNKANQGNSQAKEWFNPIIEDFVNTINNQLLTQFMQLSYNRLKIK
jgi:hypothetical protein